MTSFFNSPTSQAHFLEQYEAMLNKLPVKFSRTVVETSFGNTYLIKAGPVDGPPLLLLHGANTCAPMALEAMLGLTTHFRVYAVDIIGQPTPSAPTRPSMHGHGYGEWMTEILARLHLRAVTLVGISFGGFIALKTLLFDERRIRQAFLISPMGIAPRCLLRRLWPVILSMKGFQWTSEEPYLDYCISLVFSQPNEFTRAFLANVLQNFTMDFSSPPMLSSGAAKSIETPLHLWASEHDVFCSGEQLILRARQLFPSLISHTLLKNANHFPAPADFLHINSLIKASN